MGQSIGWYRFSKDKSKHIWADDVPEVFTVRFYGRWDWFSLMLDVPYERTDMTDDAMFRPTDFTAFREKLKLAGMLEPDEDGDNVFREMTNWLEQHADVYVNYD